MSSHKRQILLQLTVYSTTHLNSKIRHGDPNFKNDTNYCPMSSHFQFFARTFAEETWGSPSIAPQAKTHTKQSSKLIKVPILVFTFISKKKLYGRPDIQYGPYRLHIKLIFHHITATTKHFPNQIRSAKTFRDFRFRKI